MPDCAPHQIDEAAPGALEAPQIQRDAYRRLQRRSRLGRLRDKVLKYVEPLQVALLAVIVMGSLLAVGTVHLSSLLVVASVALLSLTLVCFTESDWKARVPPPAWVLLGLSLYSLLQSVPLPLTWLRHASPAAAQVWLDARRLIGTATQSSAPLSLDPGASRAEALKWLTYAAVFVTGAHIARSSGARRGLSIVVLSALTGGVLTITHGLLGLEKWLGLYQPLYAHPPWALSPLLNPNNFSGYLNLATYIAVGLVMTERPPAPRWALGLISALLFALSLLTASRGGVLALLIGMLLVALTLREQGRRANRPGIPTLPSWLPLLGAAVAGSSLFLLGSNDIIWEQLLDETTSKLRIVEWTAPLIRDYRWFGVGRGAYETISAAYRSLPGLGTYQHAENFIADWAAEWGVIASTAAFISFGWLLRPSKTGFLRHPLPTATLIGVFVLFLQNLVDLGLEVTAVGIALATTLGSIWGGATRAQERRQRRTRRSATSPGSSRNYAPSAASTAVPFSQDTGALSRTVRRTVKERKSKRKRSGEYRALGPTIAAAIAAILGSALIVLVASTSRPDVLEEKRKLHDTMGNVPWSDSHRVAEFRSAITEAMGRHPADAYLPVLGALVAKNTGKNDLPWLNQALRRDPLNARAELLLAESLVARGARTQALDILRRCVNHEPNLANVVAERATRYTQKIEELELVVPDGKTGVAMLNALAMYENKPETRALHDALLSLALKRQSNSPATRGLLVDDLLRDLENPNGPCDGGTTSSCESQLREHAAVIEQQEPHSLQAVLVHSRILVHDGKLDEAAKWLEQQCREFTSDVSCAAQWVAVASRAQSPQPLEQAASSYLALACSTPDACANAATWIGNLFMARGNYDLALTRYERAALEAPSTDSWLRVADAAIRSDHVNRAQSALMSAHQLGGMVDANLERRIEQGRREQLLRGALKH